MELYQYLIQQEPLGWVGLLFLFYFILQLTVVGRVIISRRTVGESLAWIMIVFVLPVLGLVIYLLIGELKLGNRRKRRITQAIEPIERRLQAFKRPSLSVNWHEVGYECQQFAFAGERFLGAPALPGNEIELIDQWEVIFDRMIADIDQATEHCDFEFYIWENGGRVDEVVAAIERCRQRGVTCRILVDAQGSRKFLRSNTAQRLQRAGVEFQAALPSALWKLPFVRFDLRRHVKLVLIDDRIAYTGSLNMVDPRYFKQRSNVGQWIDAMVRIRGPVVEALAISFQAAWYVERNMPVDDLPDMTLGTDLTKHGNTVIQMLPSGPIEQLKGIEHLLLSAIYMARREILITSPYFVPNEALQMALVTAAKRGVKVSVIVPEKVDSLLVRLATIPLKGELFAAGINIFHFTGGLLHTKSVVVDEKLVLFGSLNLDPRSFNLNFEMTIAVYDRPVAKTFKSLHESYLRQSHLMNYQAWSQRSLIYRLAEGVARLFGPLL